MVPNGIGTEFACNMPVFLFYKCKTPKPGIL
ncbi:hypothetical protein T11_11995 [Trichinella zimbabwensis]|uniref:Uncharacterized protein n=1 Tax=Trichinella zimbabwensis TaxID=268475 RepID=A0A0V1GEN1_9BILA|nr:hypothetical protein T11_11995 [Trichinella zimbabwensis]